MKLYALYYYDRPLLSAWLNHYCRFKCITEIIIQNQNWSNPDTLFLLDTVADYIDEHGKKIVVLPSNFLHTEGEKRSQFKAYGQSKIRNRVMQFLQEDTFIAGSMDEVIYGQGYRDTERQLKKFEKLAETRAEKGETTVGYVPLLCVWKEEIAPCNGIPISRWNTPSWRHRIFKFTAPFRRKLSMIHDTTYRMLIEGKWVDVTPPSSARTKADIPENGVALDLKLLHYHTLVRSSFESAEFILPHKKEIKHIRRHPRAFISELLNISETEILEEKESTPQKQPTAKKQKAGRQRHYVLHALANVKPILHIVGTRKFIHLTDRHTRYSKIRQIDKKTSRIAFCYREDSINFVLTGRERAYTLRVDAVKVSAKQGYNLYIGRDLVLEKICDEDVGVTITLRN